jgi:hypothetical protein
LVLFWEVVDDAGDAVFDQGGAEVDQEAETFVGELEVNAINLRLSGSACSSGGNPEVSRVSSYAERSGPV